ncbi:LuxR C-terminal-related transcriptional regulator [Lentzea sp. NPDC051213]|uniref:LuxR C-terminal-related transcriptional regulator n=1 Tax=Lentzea sp. NPDC051213 TaxID=3364126 RepID=UPI0037968F20
MAHGGIVGRAGELRLFEHDLELLRAGRGSATAIAGGPGIGKTRLLATLGGVAQACGVATHTVQVTVNGAVAALAEARRTTGVAMFVDDVHVLGADSAPLLEELIQLAGVRPLLLVLAYRPRQVGPVVGTVLSAAESSANLRHVRLGPLDLAEAKALLAGHDDVERVHSEGSGNPLYMKLIAGHAAEPAGGLLGELAGLGTAELRVAWAACVLGGPFNVNLLAEVCALDPTTTSRSVEALVAADVLRPGDPVSLLDFRHPVVADVVYRHIPIGERWRLHSRVDEVLARFDAVPAQRARHIAAAGLNGPEHVDVLLAAAAANLDADPARALHWANAAGALMPHGDSRSSEVQALVARSGLLLGDVTKTRDGLLSSCDRTANVLYAGRALALLGQCDEARALLRGGVAAVPEERSLDAAALLTDLAILHSDSDDFESAARCAATAEGIARRHGDRLHEAAALAERAWARGCAGDIESAREMISTAAAMVDAMSDAVLMRDVRCLFQVGIGENLVEDLVSAHRHLARGVALCRRTGQRHVMSALLQVLGEVQLRAGRVATAVATLDEAVHQANRDHLVPQQAIAAGVRGIAQYWLGGDDAGVRADAEAIEARCAGVRWGWAVFGRCMAGELIALTGDPKRGSQLLLTLGGGPELPLVPSRRQVRTWESLSLAALTLGDSAAARRYVDLAACHSSVEWSAARRGIARRARLRLPGAEPEELAAVATAAIGDFAGIDHWMDLAITEHLAGQAFLDARRPDLADVHLDRAAGHAAACGSARLAGLVAVARERLDRSPRPAWSSPLTTREAEIAELAGTGLTSAEIGRRLYLSTRTVDSHLGRVYRKLGVSNRNALAQLVATQGRQSRHSP